MDSPKRSRGGSPLFVHVREVDAFKFIPPPQMTRSKAKLLWALHVAQRNWSGAENRCADVGHRCQKELPRPRGHQKEVGSSDGLITS